MKNLWMLAALLTAAVALVVACGDDDADEPTSTATVTATVSGEPTEGPTEGPTDTPTSLPPAADADPLVYTTQIGTEERDSRTWPTRAVVVYDRDTGNETARLEYGGVDHFPLPAGSTDGEFAYVGTEREALRLALDGSGETVLYEDPNAALGHVALSPDGSVLAVTRPGFLSGIGAVIFIDPESGDLLTEVGVQDPGFADFRGDPWLFAWMEDSSGIVVMGATYSENPGSIALVATDGSVEVFELEGFQYIAPGGGHIAHGAGSLGCMFVSGTGLSLFETSSTTEVASIDVDGLALSPRSWSPDGETFLFEGRPAPPAGEPQGPADDPEACAWTRVDPMLFTTSLDGAVSEVDDLDALLDAWWGDDRIQFRCPERTYDLEVRPSTTLAAGGCANAGTSVILGDILLDGVEIGSATDIFVIGGVGDP